MSGLFSEIQGGGFKLKHVTDDQKNWKQPKREPVAVSFEDLERKKAAAEERRRLKEEAKKAEEEKKAAEAAAVAGATAKVNSPVFELEGDKRWVIRHQRGTPNEPVRIVIPEPRMMHAVFIQHCEHVFLDVQSKINSVTIIESKKLQISLVSVVATVEVTNSVSIDVQVKQSLPSAQLSNVHGANLFLLDPELSRDTEVVTTSCSTINVNFPDEHDSSDLLERPLPDQFVSKLVPDGKGGYRVETKPCDI